MKKLLALLLSGVMVLTVSVPVLAGEEGNSETANGDTASTTSTNETNKTKTVPEDGTATSSFTDGGTSKGDVVVKIEGSDKVTRVYKVDVVWSDLNFTYTFDENSTPIWDVSTHTYNDQDGATTDGWGEKNLGQSL